MNGGLDKKDWSQHYNPQEVEKRLYKQWESKGYFSPSSGEASPKKCFSIVLPPPNVTGSLHLGHALNHTIQDCLIRWKKMRGYRSVWLPGTDHAGIATQIQVEKDLAKKKQTRIQLGREEFLKQVWEWKHKYGSEITHQMRSIGDSCDWSRHLFTLDDMSLRAVRKAFVHLFKKGKIYRGTRLVNWSSGLSSAISDLEVEYKEISSCLWYIRYYLEDKKNYLVVCTTRPETLLGDQAVAVHPEDERFKKYHGKKVYLPLVNRLIPIIVNDYVDRNFGTGVLKITPAHDFNDYKIGQQHQLENLNILDTKGYLNKNAGVYKGLKVLEAREKILFDLKDQNLIEKEEPYSHQVGFCSRSGSRIEPYLSDQWFLKMEGLAQRALDSVINKKEVEFIPHNWLSTFEHWMKNINDWCVSRQLWWGHRIPAWFCSNCSQITVSEEDQVKKCEHCSSLSIHQDEDVLDTWFSSALWPMSVLQWPQNKSLKNEPFFPTSVLVTGPDILFFWVARMIMMSLEFQNQIPFRSVYLHGVIRDAQGRKMSKTLGNGEDPIDLIQKYGADALRFFLLSENKRGRDLRFSRDYLKICRNFMNKIWNAARFIYQNFDIPIQKPKIKELSLMDQWVIHKLKQTEGEVNQKLDSFDFSSTCSILHRFTWLEFCDWYLEWVRSLLYGKKIVVQTEDYHTVWSSTEEKEDNKKKLLVSYYVLCYVFNRLLRLLHPVIPFITEEIYQKWSIKDQLSILLDSYPQGDVKFSSSSSFQQEQVLFFRSIVSAIRNLRGENNIKSSMLLSVQIYSNSNKDLKHIESLLKDSLSNIFFIEKIKKLALVNQISDQNLSVVMSLEGSITKPLGLSSDIKVVILLDDVMDLNLEEKRLEKKIKKYQKQIEQLRAQLNSFNEKVPQKVLDDKKEQYQSLQSLLETLKQDLQRIRKLLKEQ